MEPKTASVVEQNYCFYLKDSRCQVVLNTVKCVFLAAKFTFYPLLG